VKLRGCLISGCIFHDKVSGIFSDEKDLLIILALVNSAIFRFLLQLQITFGSYEIGVIQRTPITNLSTSNGEQIGKLALRIGSIKRALDTANETSHVFHLPALLQDSDDTLA